MADPTRNELLDAFRPGMDDGALAELADLAAELDKDPQLRAVLERSQQWDAAVQRAMQATPVPAGLAERIEAAMSGQAAVVDETVDAVEQTEDSSLAEAASSESLVDPAPPIIRSSRRWWVASLAAAAAATWMLIALWPRPQPLDGAKLAGAANVWAEHLDSLPLDAWLQGEAPEDRPMAATVRMKPPRRWQRLNRALAGCEADDPNDVVARDPQAIVYRTARVMLLVIRVPDAEGLGAAPPDEPQFNTGNRRIGAWKSDGLVYVLVVTGDLPAYRRTLTRPLSA